MKKRPFVLLEVLVALSLVILCATPLILQPIRAYQSEMILFEQVERERLADWTFSEIKEMMLANMIPWDNLPQYNETSGPFSLQPGNIQILGKEPKKIDRSYTLFCKGEKQGINGETYRMIYIKIELKPQLAKKNKIYTYRMVAQKILYRI